MAGNLSEPGMDNFNVFDGANQNFCGVMSNIAPGEINTYAPGSPRPMRDVDQENDVCKAVDATLLHHDFSGLNVSSGHSDSFQAKMNTGNNVEEHLKDAQIRHLNRNVTMLQAKLHQFEGMKEKYETAMKHTMDQGNQAYEELRRAQEQIVCLNQDKERRMMMTDQITEENSQLKRSLQQRSVERGLLIGELNKLGSENNSLKQTVESYSSESLMASEFCQNSTSESNPLLCNPVVSRELDSLHKVVDSLKSTVLQQRQFLIKLKASQTSSATNSVSSIRKAVPGAKELMSGGNISMAMASSQHFPHLRQGEEGAAPSFPDLKEQTDPSGRRPSNGTSDTADDLFYNYAPTRHSGSSAGSMFLPVKAPITRFDVDVKNAPIACAPLHGNSNGYVNNAAIEVYEHSSASLAQNSTDQLYMNASELCQRPDTANSPKLSRDRNSIHKVMRDPFSLADVDSLGRPTQEGAKRKLSHSEVICQRPTASININLPIRSKTENFGYNPKIKSQLQPERFLQSQQPTPPLSPAEPLIYQRKGQAEPHWQESDLQPPIIPKPSATRLNQTSVQPQVQSSHYYRQQQQQQQRPPVHFPPSTVVGGAIPDCIQPFGALSTTASTHTRYTPEDSNSDNNGDSLPLHSPQINSDRLCPVCNRDFGSVTIDEFQSHVLECFDNENGPETMVAEDRGPEQVCPMCNKHFRVDVSQSDFAKHVHSHFGEDPGDNFEVILS